MKKILQKSYAWLVMLVAWFAVSISAMAQDATFDTIDGTKSSNGITYSTWASYDPSAGINLWGGAFFTIEAAENIEKIVLRTLSPYAYIYVSVTEGNGHFDGVFSAERGERLNQVVWVADGDCKKVVFTNGEGSADFFVRYVDVYLGSAAPFEECDYSVTYPEGVNVSIKGSAVSGSTFHATENFSENNVDVSNVPDGYKAVVVVDHEGKKVTVTLEEIVPAKVTAVYPTPGNILLDNDEYGLRNIHLVFEGGFDKAVYAGEGNPVPEGVTLTKDGTTPITINDSYGFTMWQGGTECYVNTTPSYLTEPGTYVLHIPAGINTIGGKPTEEVNVTWTVVAATTFKVESYLVSPYTTVKALPSFSVSAPDGVTFDKVQNPTTLKLQGEYDNVLGDYTYTDVPATVALDEGKAVFTFTTPYSDKASLNFKVPAGVISDANGLTSEEFTASFNVDPYEYFTATPNLQSWEACEGPVMEIELTLPEDVEVAEVDDNLDIKVDGNSWMIFDTEIDNAKHTVTIYLDDPIESGTHSIVIPQGYLKVSDYVVSREIELYGVKVLGANDPFPYTAATPSTWSNITNQTLAEAPIVITFARELDGVDASKIGFQTPGGTKTAAEFNAEIPGAVTLTTEGKDLKIKFSDEFLASSYMDCDWTAQFYVQLGAGAVTCKASVNEENMWGICFYYNCLKSFTMSDAEWCTMALTSTFGIPAGYTAYYVSAVSAETITLTTLATEGQTVNAYVPFLLNGPAKTVYYGNGSDAKNVPWGITNFLIGNYEDGDPFTYVASSIATNSNYWDYTRDSMMDDCKLYQLSFDNNGENLGFYTQTGTNGESIEVPQGKAFLVVPDYYTSSNSPKRFVFEDGTVVTGLTAVEVPMEKDAIYNLQGQRVAAPAQGGVYVKNGKKFIVK